MHDIRWLEIPAGKFDGRQHPSAIFIDRAQFSVFRVLQVRLSDGDVVSNWVDVPIVNYVEA